MNELTDAETSTVTANERKEDHSGVSWSTVLVSTATSVLVAILAAGTTLYATERANSKDRELTQIQMDAERREKARTKREEVYHDFLNAANDYATETNALLDKCQAAARSVQPNKTPDCGISSFAGFAAKYQRALNAMYIYASPEALRGARVIAAELPGSVWNTYTLKRVDVERFSAAYSAFVGIMCRDLRPDPNQSCTP